MRSKAVVFVGIGLCFVGAAWFGPARNTTGQDQSDERLAALETQVSDQAGDINSLWKHVRVLETAAAPSDSVEPTEESGSTGDGNTLSGTGKQSTEPAELDGAYNVAATCDSGFLFSLDVVNVTNPDSFEFVNLYGETPFDGSAVATFDGDRYAFTVNCDGNWTLTFVPLS